MGHPRVRCYRCKKKPAAFCVDCVEKYEEVAKRNATELLVMAINELKYEHKPHSKIRGYFNRMIRALKEEKKDADT